jgi:transposase
MKVVSQKVYGNDVEVALDPDVASALLQLEPDKRYRPLCHDCGGVRVEKFDFADASQRVTHRLAWYVHNLCAKLTIKDVSEHLDLDPKTVKEIDKAFLEEHFGQNDYDGLRVLMIDMWEPFINRVRHHVPHAKIVFDFFHVVQC